MKKDEHNAVDNRPKVEKATLQDAPFLAVMVYRAMEESGVKLDEEKRKGLLLQIMQSAVDPAKSIYVATINKHNKRRIVGMGIAAFTQDVEGRPSANCGYLYIEPKYRGLGITRMIFDFGVKDAMEKGVERLYSEVKPNDEKSKESLTKAGYKVGAIIMYRDLKSEEVSK